MVYGLELVCSGLVELSKHELRVQIVVDQTWRSGYRRSDEIRGQVMSENEELSEAEWLDQSRKGSSMTSSLDVVAYCDTLWTSRNVQAYA